LSTARGPKESPHHWPREKDDITGKEKRCPPYVIECDYAIGKEMDGLLFILAPWLGVVQPGLEL